MIGEIDICGIIFWVRCPDCGDEIQRMFLTKQEFVDYLTSYGWKAGYLQERTVWYCPECAER